MAIKFIRNFLAIVLSVSVIVSAFPQQSFAQGETTSELTGTRKQVATIIFSGLAGAILGLSTLSFYGKPQERLSNIAVGFAVGIIGGVIYTSYNMARSPYEHLQSMNMNFDDELSKRWSPGEMTFAPTLASWSF